MLEKVSQLAEQAATNVSRRQFLGRFGRGAMVVAAAAGGLLAMAQGVHAGRGGRPCTTDCDCRKGQICSGGRCVSGVHVCDANSTSSCAGLTVGSVCLSGGFTGVCTGCPSCHCDTGNRRRGGR